MFTIKLWHVHYYQVMTISHHFTSASPPTWQKLISIQITNAWWIRASQRLFIYFLVSGDPIYLHSRLATQEVTNPCVKLHDEMSKANRIPWVKNYMRKRQKKKKKKPPFGDWIWNCAQILSKPWLSNLPLHIIYFKSMYLNNQIYFLFSLLLPTCGSLERKTDSVTSLIHSGIVLPHMSLFTES